MNVVLHDMYTCVRGSMDTASFFVHVSEEVDAAPLDYIDQFQNLEVNFLDVFSLGT